MQVSPPPGPLAIPIGNSAEDPSPALDRDESQQLRRRYALTTADTGADGLIREHRRGGRSCATYHGKSTPHSPRVRRTVRPEIRPLPHYLDGYQFANRLNGLQAGHSALLAQ